MSVSRRLARHFFPLAFSIGACSPSATTPPAATAANPPLATTAPAATAPPPEAAKPAPKYSQRAVGLTGAVVAASKMPADKDRGPAPEAKAAPPPLASRGGGIDLRPLYRNLAPAVVLVKTSDGFGSGFVIDGKAGLVVTNHHVIAHAEVDDGKQRVTVKFGRLDKATGRMVIQPDDLVAWVVKSDAALDLAVLRLEKPPTDLAMIKLAKDDPQPGQPAVALGHAGIGLLWAIKDGEVAAVGKLSENLALLAGFDCHETAAEPYDSHECSARHADLQTAKGELDKAHGGTVVQTTCPIAPGDSGGPLLSLDGELIGVNDFLRTDDKDVGARAYFHIAVSEVRAYLAAPAPAPAAAPTPTPVAAAAMTPRPGPATEPTSGVLDPWSDAGPAGAIGDIDGDGIPDVLVTSDGPQSDARTVMMDLDEDSFPHGAAPPVSEIIRRHAFDAEVAIVKVGRGAYVAYDTDNDGAYDTVIYGRAFPGTPEAVLRRDGNGAWHKTDDHASAWLEPELVPASMRGRLIAILHALESSGH